MPVLRRQVPGRLDPGWRMPDDGPTRLAVLRLRIFPALTPRRRVQVWYGPLLALAMLLNMLRLLAYARLLPVEAFGEVSAALLISSSFCMLGCFGLLPILQRDWPRLALRGQHRRAWILVVQCCAVAIATALVLGALSATGIRVAGLTGPMLTMSILCGLTQQLFLVITTESRSAGNVLAYARHQFLRGAAVLGVVIAMASQGAGAYSLIAAEAVISLSAVLAILIFTPRTGVPKITLLATAAARGLPKVSWYEALTMMAVVLVSFAMVNVDRWLAAQALDTIKFGLYSFAVIVLSVAQSCQGLVNASMFPLIARRQASEGTRGSFRVSMKLSAMVGGVGLLFVLPAIWAAQLGIARWYPAFDVVSTWLPWLGLIGLLRAADFWSSFLIIDGRESIVLALNCASMTIALLVWWGYMLHLPQTAQQPWAYAALAGLVTALGATSTFVAALIIGSRHPAATPGRTMR